MRECPRRHALHAVGRQRQRLTDMQGGAVTDIAGVVENCDMALRMAEEMAKVDVEPRVNQE